MPAYLTAPPEVTNRTALIPGKIGYSFGYDQGLADTRLQVTSVAIASNVATLAFTWIDGPTPIVGNVTIAGSTYTGAPLVTVRGTQTATSGGAPNFNVTGVTLASISITASTGVGTLTYALTSSNISTTPDAGQIIIPAYLVTESLGAGPTAGLQFAVSRTSGSQNAQRGITWFTQYTGSPATVSANLQGADIDAAANYTTVDTSTAAGGESRSVGTINYRFYRISISSTGGSSPTVACGIEVV